VGQGPQRPFDSFSAAKVYVAVRAALRDRTITTIAHIRLLLMGLA
jgi:hypothetical protein